MRITLEKAELVSLLSKALNYEFTEDDIEIQADPFEVHIRRVRLGDLAASTPTAAAKAPPPVVPATKQSGYPEDRPLAELGDLLEQNEEMLRENLAPGETYDPPSPDEEEYLGR